MPPVQPTSFRLSDEDLRLIRELEDHLGIARLAVLRMAVRELYRAQIKPRSRPKKKSSSGDLTS